MRPGVLGSYNRQGDLELPPTGLVIGRADSDDKDQGAYARRGGQSAVFLWLCRRRRNKQTRDGTAIEEEVLCSEFHRESQLTSVPTTDPTLLLLLVSRRLNSLM